MGEGDPEGGAPFKPLESGYHQIHWTYSLNHPFFKVKILPLIMSHILWVNESSVNRNVLSVPDSIFAF